MRVDDYKVCKLVSDLSLAPRSAVPVVKGRDGLKYYRVGFTVRMTIEDDVLKFELLYWGTWYVMVDPKFE